MAEQCDNIELQEVENIIYESVETIAAIQKRDLKTILQSDIRRYKRVGVGVGLLCAVLALLNVAVPLYLHQTNMVERVQLVNSYKQLLANLTRERDQLLASNNNRERLKRGLCEKSSGFTYDDGLCYRFSNGKMNWTESRQWCKDRQSDLMVIKSQETQDFVERVNKRVWLGLTDTKEEDVFWWVDGTQLTTPTYWAPGQPNNHPQHNGLQDCVEFNDGSGGGSRGWNDAPCRSYKNWICERVLC